MEFHLIAIYSVLLFPCALVTSQQNACQPCPTLSNSKLLPHSKVLALLNCNNQTSAIEISEQILGTCTKSNPAAGTLPDDTYCARFKYTATKQSDARVTYEVFYRVCFAADKGLTQACTSYLVNTKDDPRPPKFEHISSDDDELAHLMPNMKLQVSVCDDDACGREGDEKYGGGDTIINCKDSGSEIPGASIPRSERPGSEAPSARTTPAPKTTPPHSTTTRGYKTSGAGKTGNFVMRTVFPALVMISLVQKY